MKKSRCAQCDDERERSYRIRDFESRAAARRAQEQIRRKALAKQVYVTNVHGARRT